MMPDSNFLLVDRLLSMGPSDPRLQAFAPPGHFWEVRENPGALAAFVSAPANCITALAGGHTKFAGGSVQSGRGNTESADCIAPLANCMMQSADCGLPLASFVWPLARAHRDLAGDGVQTGNGGRRFLRGIARISGFVVQTRIRSVCCSGVVLQGSL